MPIEYSTQLKPGALAMPASLRRSLKRLAENTYTRGPRYWETPSAESITQHTVTELKLKNLVRIKHGSGRDRLLLTELGKEVVGLTKGRRNGGDA